jgi:anaerobic dimethyl sulfoxide reductase subunit A
VQPEVAGAHPFDPRHRPLLARVDPDDVWMNPMGDRGPADGADLQRSRLDAAAGQDHAAYCGWRGFDQGGAWFKRDSDGMDTKGCANVLADDRSAPCGAMTYNTNLVEVERPM